MFNRWRTAATVLMVMLGALAWFNTGTAAAQEESTYPLQVLTLQCEEATCTDENSVPVGDILVIASSEDGATEFGTCTTTVEEGCTIPVPPGETVVISVEASTIPDGYVALDYPVTFQAPLEATGEPDVSIVFSLQQDTVPDDSDTDEEVAEESDTSDEDISSLPETGVGTQESASNQIPYLMISLAALLAIAATAFVAVRNTDR